MSHIKHIDPGLYRHHKGSLYYVYEVAQDSESEDCWVVYRPLYGDMKLWVRPFDMFLEYIESKGVGRFELLRASEKPLSENVNELLAEFSDLIPAKSD